MIKLQKNILFQRVDQELVKTTNCWSEAETRFDLCFNPIASGRDAIRTITMFCISFWSSRVRSGLYLHLIYPWMVWIVTLLRCSFWLWYFDMLCWLWKSYPPSIGSSLEARRRTTFGENTSSNDGKFDASPGGPLRGGQVDQVWLIFGGLGTKAQGYGLYCGKKMCVLKQQGIKGITLVQPWSLTGLFACNALAKLNLTNLTRSAPLSSNLNLQINRKPDKSAEMRLFSNEGLRFPKDSTDSTCFKTHTIPQANHWSLVPTHWLIVWIDPPKHRGSRRSLKGEVSTQIILYNVHIYLRTYLNMRVYHYIIYTFCCFNVVANISFVASYWTHGLCLVYKNSSPKTGPMHSGPLFCYLLPFWAQVSSHCCTQCCREGNRWEGLVANSILGMGLSQHVLLLRQGDV